MHITRVPPAGRDAALADAADVLRAGGLVAFPTESFYAIGADALNPEAVARVFAAKGRVSTNPLPVIIHDKALIHKYVRRMDPLAEKAVETLMPGPVTIIFWATGAFPEALTAGTGKVGIRVPDHEIAAGLARALGGPITATSANMSGMPGLTEPGEVEKALGQCIDLLIDTGRTPGQPPSTLLDITVSPPVILRYGRVEKARIEATLGPLKS